MEEICAVSRVQQSGHNVRVELAKSVRDEVCRLGGHVGKGTLVPISVKTNEESGRIEVILYFADITSEVSV
jgi:uncharacterized metal-binding protein